jgi:hypothetical protein
MKHFEIDEIIKRAILDNQTITVKFKHGTGDELELDFDPYIYGDDTMQYGFVWGYLPTNLLFYKFMVDSIISVKLTQQTFIVHSEARYLYSLEEEHWGRVKAIEEPVLHVYNSIP